MVIRLGTCGVPPGRAGRAPHASRHNMADDVAIELGDGGAVASVVAIAVALEEGLVVGATGRRAGGGLRRLLACARVDQGCQADAATDVQQPPPAHSVPGGGVPDDVRPSRRNAHRFFMLSP